MVWEDEAALQAGMSVIEERRRAAGKSDSDRPTPAAVGRFEVYGQV